MEHKFKVGDRVRIVSAKEDNEGAHRSQIGMEAVVIKVDIPLFDYELKFDEENRYAFEDDHFENVLRSVYEDEIELVYRPAGRQRIVIEYDGKVTTAKMLEGKSVVKTARCVRADGDEHDMAFAMRLLCDRLFPESVKHDEPVKPEEEYQMFTGRAVCIRGAGEGLSEGRIYDFVNGETVDEQGNKRPAVVLSRPEHIAWFFTLFLPLKPDAETRHRVYVW